jgi:hypothetical protein
VLPRQMAEPGDVLTEGPLVALRRIAGVWRRDADLDPRAQKLMSMVQEG